MSWLAKLQHSPGIDGLLENLMLFSIHLQRLRHNQTFTIHAESITMNVITVLWSNQRLPTRNGIYFANGSAFDVMLTESHPRTLALGDELDLDAIMDAHPDELTTIDIRARHAVPELNWVICAGGGKYNSEGFFACLDAEENLRWVVYLEDSSPMVNLRLEGTRVWFTPEEGEPITINLASS